MKSEIFRALHYSDVTIDLMSDTYHQLLDAAIEHLEDLKAHGVRFVSLSPEAVSGLKQKKPLSQSPVKSQISDLKSQIPGQLSGDSGVPAAAASALSPEAKAAAFAELRRRALVCVKSGQLLTKIIQTMGLTREKVYIANILKCRPDTPGQTSGNRKPTPQEMQTCIPYLHEQIDLIRPRVIVALGGTAVEGLLGKPVFITKLRGQWQTYRGIPLMPTYHPSYLLRNQSMSQKRQAWEDMLQVMEKIDMPISEKQRNFFTKNG